MEEVRYEHVGIGDLYLNPENSRFNTVEHQQETIEAMIKDQEVSSGGNKLLALANHILENGLSPMEIILVQPYKDKFLVMDGNRRVTSLKLISDPSIIPQSYGRLRRRFEEINQKVDETLLRRIYCVIMDDDDKINEWIRLKHTGQNDGAGLVPWNAHQTARYSNNVKNKTDYKFVFLEGLKEHDGIPPNIRSKIRGIKKTNFDRLIGDPDVREFLGIQLVKKRYSIDGNIKKSLLYVLKGLIDEEINVNDIYYKKDRMNYLESLKRILAEEVVPTSIPPVQTTLEAEVSGDTKTEEEPPRLEGKASIENIENEVVPADNSTSQRNRKRDMFQNCKTIIPWAYSISSDNPRINRVIMELKKLEVDSFPNSCGALLRILFELSSKYYLESLDNTDHSNDAL